MKRILLLSFVFMAGLATQLIAQTGLYVPSAKPIKNMQRALYQPEVFCLLIQFEAGDTACKISDLDWLDSAYNMAIRDRYNPKFYTMTIEGYGDSDESTTRSRVDWVYNYFANRCHAPFPIRYAYNNIHCSCHGDTTELLRFEVPVFKFVYDCAELPESRRVFNKTIPLQNCVLVTFRNDPDECIGMSRGCFIPARDSIIRGYYTQMRLQKGSVYSVSNTKDECPPPLVISLEEHLDYKEIVERYFLIPHRKQILVQAGYVVIHSNFNRERDECSQVLLDSVYIRVPLTPLQVENGVKLYGKKMGPKGPEYKSLRTRKIKSKDKMSVMAEAAINPTMFDTIFLGLKIEESDCGKYFIKAQSDTEESAFKIGDKYYKAYRVDRQGGYIINKGLEEILNIQEYKEDEEFEDARNNDGDEEIE